LPAQFNLILWLEKQRLELVRRVLLNVKDAIDPLDDNAETCRLAHVLHTWDKSCLLRRTMLQCEVVVVNGENLVFCSIDEE